MIKKAEEFAKRKSEKSGMHRTEEAKNRYYDAIMSEIKSTLDNKNFIMAPQHYMLDWKKDRGPTEQWICGKDDAFEFFTKGLN